MPWAGPLSYGPFTVTFGAALTRGATDDPAVRKGKEEPSDIYGFQRFERERSDFEQERLHGARPGAAARFALAASQGKERARITVKGRGLFYVTAAQIANSLGVPLANVAALISGHNLNLTSMGKNIAWLADRNGAGIFFLQRGDGDPVCRPERLLAGARQRPGHGDRRRRQRRPGRSRPDLSGRPCISRKTTIALTALFNEPKDDIWLWDYVVAGGSAKSFPVDGPRRRGCGYGDPDRHPAGSDRYRWRTTTTMPSFRSTAARSATAYWDGTKDHTFAVQFHASLLQEAPTPSAVRGALDMGAPYSIFYVESFDLSYQREYKAVNNTLLCRGDGNSVITVTRFHRARRCVVLDVSNPERPKQVVGVAPDVSGRVTFVSRDAGSTYLVSGLNAALRPLAVVGDRPAQLKDQGNSAEYVVIAPEEFKDAAQELADYRKSKGLKTLVVTLEDIYESFNYGLPSPLAIRDFLAYAYANWGGKKVKYAVLVGKGTYDYKDYLGSRRQPGPGHPGQDPRRAFRRRQVVRRRDRQEWPARDRHRPPAGGHQRRIAVHDRQDQGL